MVGYILDTDTWIEYFHHRSGIGAHIAKISPEHIYVSEVSIAELTSTSSLVLQPVDLA